MSEQRDLQRRTRVIYQYVKNPVSLDCSLEYSPLSHTSGSPYLPMYSYTSRKPISCMRNAVCVIIGAAKRVSATTTVSQSSQHAFHFRTILYFW